MRTVSADVLDGMARRINALEAEVACLTDRIEAARMALRAIQGLSARDGDDGGKAYALLCESLEVET